MVGETHEQTHVVWLVPLPWQPRAGYREGFLESVKVE